MEQNKEHKINGYDLSRQWFDFAFENPDKINTNHCALWFWIVDLCNRLGWKEKFGLPTVHTMEALGIKSYNTFKATFDDLIQFGFIILIEKSKNQYTTNIIAISNFNKAQYKALDEALIKAHAKHSIKQNDIDKPLNNETNETRKAGEAFTPTEIISYLNEKAQRQFKPNSKKTISLIQTRGAEGFIQADFLKVIDNKVADWKGDIKMDRFLRPETLFGTKFESYLNETIISCKKKGNGPASIEIDGMDHTNQSLYDDGRNQ